MVLSSWHSHCESSPGSFDEYRLSAGWLPTLRPNQPIRAVSPPIGCYHPQTPSPFKPECNDLPQFREDRGGPSMPVWEFNLTACPLVQSSWKTPFQIWIWTQADESSAHPASRHCCPFSDLAHWATNTDPGHKSVPGNVTYVFCCNDGLLLHITFLWRMMNSNNFSLVAGHNSLLHLRFYHNHGWLLNISLFCGGYYIPFWSLQKLQRDLYK